MRAKWLWTTWAHLALVVVIALAIGATTFANIFFVPRLQKILREGWLDLDSREAPTAWFPSFLQGMELVTHNLVWLLLLVAVLWGLFEWRVHSENKSLIRLSVLATAALRLVV